MVVTSTAPKPWSPPWDPKTAFMVRAADVLERGEFEAELASFGAGRIFPFQIEQAFMEGVEALLADHPADIERIREVQAAFEALEPGQKLPAEEQGLIEGAREAVRAHWPAFRALIAQEAKRQEIMPTLAFRRFCTGWEGGNIDGSPLPEYRAGIDRLILLDTMKAVDPILIRLVGLHAHNLMWATGDAKNSAAPLPSDKSQAPSEDTSRKGGSSAGNTGRRTPSSKPRRKRSPS